MTTGDKSDKGQRQGLSKPKLMAHRQCPKRLWLQTFRPELADESGAEAQFAAGHAVGEAARRLHPGGELIEGDGPANWLEETARALAERPRKPLYEATFDHHGTLVRADLLLPRRRGYRLVEVKASGSVKPHYAEDVAIQGWVLERAGVSLAGLELAHIDTAWVYPGGSDYEGLLVYADVAAEAGLLIDEVGDWVEAARETLAGKEPDIAPGPQCTDPYECPFLGYCSPSPAPGAYPLSDLPRGKRVAAELAAEGFDDLRDVPAKRLSNERHRMVHRAVRSGKRVLSGGAGRALARIGWPRRYLDFETIPFAVPVWASTRPYQQIPFQWSCHMELRNGSVMHHEFLADDAGDPRRAFAESLLEVLGDDDGPIFVYNAGFERGRMRELAEAFPDLAPPLEAAIERLVDLLPLVRDNYYHPEQHGSWSLKAVAPTIAPELAYHELEIAAGGAASEAYRRLLDTGMAVAEAAALRAALGKYCARDTLALVRIARFLQNQGGA